MKTKNEVVGKLKNESGDALLAHFNKVYECHELGINEDNIIYLAWMWKNGLVHEYEDGNVLFDEAVVDATHTDYEISFESDTSGGVNLRLTFDYYRLDELMNIIG